MKFTNFEKSSLLWAVLVVGLLTYGAQKMAALSDALSSQQAQALQTQAALQAENGKLREENKAGLDALAQRLDQQNAAIESIKGNTQTAEGLSAAFQGNQAALQALQQSYDAGAADMASLQQKLYYSMRALGGNNVAGKTTEKASFSDYLSDDWAAVVGDFLEAFPYNPFILTGPRGGPIGMLRADRDGDMPFDGIAIRNVAAADFRNGKENAIYVLAPGLAPMKNNPLRIDVDVKGDKIFLDGCLAWAQLKDASSASVDIWRATDAAGEKRDLSIPPGTAVITMTGCDAEYLQEEEKKLLPQIWKKPAIALPSGFPAAGAADMARAYAPPRLSSDFRGVGGIPLESLKPYGGVGMSFEVTPRGLQIKVYAGRPAALAGLKTGDLVTKINNAPALNITKETAMASLRGAPGSSVTVTYQAGGTGDEKTVVLTRTLIQLNPEEISR